MRKSKAETLETRKLIVAKASQLFQDKGLEATSIADIMAAASLTQGGFYRHFESKEQLVAEANGLAFEALLGGILKRIDGKPPVKALKLIVSTYLHQHEDVQRLYLCPLASNGCQLSRFGIDVKAQAFTGFEAIALLIAEQAGTLGIRRPSAIAETIVATMVGAVTLSRLDRNQGKRILQNAQNTIDLLMKFTIGDAAE